MASGVTQGSVLGPLLFIIYINGISTDQLMPGTKIHLHADNFLLYKKIETYPNITFPSKQTSLLYVNGLKITI